MLSVSPEFKMQMLCRSTSGSPGQCDYLTRLYRITRCNKVFGIMTVHSFQSIKMPHHNYLSISTITFGHAYHTVEHTKNGIIGLGLYICSRMSTATSISRNDLPSRKWKTELRISQTLQDVSPRYFPLKTVPVYAP